MKFSIACPHEMDSSLDTKTVYPDFHPITKDELTEFLRLRYENTLGVQTLSSIQVRIGQAIPGSECPRPIEGEYARRSAKMDELYVHGPDRMELLELRDKIWALLQ